MSATAVARGVIALVAFGFLIAQPASANDAAHKMAEKFAGPSKGTKKEPAPAKAEGKEKAEAGNKTEADAQAAEARKKKEAERKAAEAKKRAAEDARRKEAQKKAEAQRRAATVEEAKRRAVEEKKAEEAEMLARARREVEEMRGAEEQTRLAEEARRLIEEAGKERARAEALLAEQTEQARSKEVEEAQLAQRRLEETKALAEKLKRVRQIREARLAAQERAAQGEKDKDKGPAEPQQKGPVVVATPPQVATVEQRDPAPERTETAQGTPAAPVATPSAQAKEPAAPVVAAAPAAPPPPTAATPDIPAAPAPPPSVAAAPAPLPEPTARVEETAARLPPTAPPASNQPAKAPPPANEKRVTVLLVLEPGTYGIRRRGPRTADPLLCTPPDGCYVSAGADRPATFLHGRKALGFGNTMGNRAGACRNSLGCVFRDVELAEMPGYLQPVDLHILKHDRRRPQAILGDSSCRSEAGRLSCTRGIYAEDYVMWIVPESLADAVGPAVLEQAVNEGLIGPRSAELYSRR